MNEKMKKLIEIFRNVYLGINIYSKKVFRNNIFG